MENLKAWSYCGYVVYPADRNAYGLKWATKSYYVGWLRTETKQQMRESIREDLGKIQKPLPRKFLNYGDMVDEILI